ncbi:MAG TPA: response regulator [Desulfuromonadales bacterium]|nr:response regulator [Desulfuromonadales bacterium]
MSTPLRLLIVEDSEDDALLLERELIKNGYELDSRRVDTPEAMKEALVTKTWDLIISDFVMPRFSGLDALRIVKDRAVDIPFIIVSGKVGEETAVEAMRAGANDYIIKGNLARLTPAIEREIRDVANRSKCRQAEDQLYQSQKMEAIGQLAGGVAHDFNNILTVILGYCDLLKMKSVLDGPGKEALEHIKSAAERAAQLTHALLAFSRKQVLDTRPVNLNELVQHVERFLVRIIGEDVHLKSMYHAVDLRVMADTGQMEQVLMNLATNARDAMPAGGELTIETSFQEIDQFFVYSHGMGTPGRYAVICVSDTGIGMNEETISRIFEPFFTTKEVGKGTGLGMAIVHGIVNQHNGFVYVYSEPGKGTTFKIFIPLLETETASEGMEIILARPNGGTETILVAEDDASVREVVVTVLKEFGYEIISASDGQEAVDTFKVNRSKINLILMDLIMPHKSGMEACKEIRLLQPDARVLFTSGYTADFIRSRGELDTGVDLIMKPVNPLGLLRKVREMLDR